MTANDFHNTFYGPANKLNRERLCGRLGIKGFAGLPLKRIGWAGFVNAVGDHYSLDVRNFTCEVSFIDALAGRLVL